MGFTFADRCGGLHLVGHPKKMELLKCVCVSSQQRFVLWLVVLTSESCRPTCFLAPGTKRVNHLKRESSTVSVTVNSLQIHFPNEHWALVAKTKHNFGPSLDLVVGCYHVAVQDFPFLQVGGRRLWESRNHMLWKPRGQCPVFANPFSPTNQTTVL